RSAQAEPGLPPGGHRGRGQLRADHADRDRPPRPAGPGERDLADRRGEHRESLRRLEKETRHGQRADRLPRGAPRGCRRAARGDPLRSLVKRILCLSDIDGEAKTLPLVPLHERQTHQPRPRKAEDWAVVTHTSGTTSVPKLAAHSTESLYGMVAAQVALSKVYA